MARQPLFKNAFPMLSLSMACILLVWSLTGSASAQNWEAPPARIGERPASMAHHPAKMPSVAMAVKLFKEVCVANRSNVMVLPDLLPRKGYLWLSEIRTFMHPSHDLSFALLQTSTGVNCSIVFATGSNPQASAAIFAENTVNETMPVYVGFPPKTTARNYIHAQIQGR